MTVKYVIIPNDAPASGVTYQKSVKALDDIYRIRGLVIILHNGELSIVDLGNRKSYKAPKLWKYDQLLEVLGIYEQMIRERTGFVERFMVVPRSRVERTQQRLQMKTLARALGYDGIEVAVYGSGIETAPPPYKAKMEPFAELIAEAAARASKN